MIRRAKDGNSYSWEARKNRKAHAYLVIDRGMTSEIRSWAECGHHAFRSERIENNPVKQRSCKRCLWKVDGRISSNRTVTLTEYLADPKAATDEAERVGRVVVKDKSGTTRLVINSHRLSESLLKQREGTMK